MPRLTSRLERPVIRPATPEDTAALVELARATEVFRPAEVVALREVLDDYHAHESRHGHRAVVLIQADQIVGFAYYAPSALSERGWYLWWIAVAREHQGRGAGSTLLRFVENELEGAQARLLWIETSSLPRYEPTRRFYLRHAYRIAAIVLDFYSDGDDQVLFVKRWDAVSRKSINP